MKKFSLMMFLFGGTTLLAAGVGIQSARAANIVETAKADGHFSQLLNANTLAGTTGILEGPGPFTVFAPNDDAFAKISPAKRSALMAPAMRTMLKVTLANHVVTGLVDLDALQKALSQSDTVVVNAANTMPLIFKREGDTFTVNGARVIKGPIRTDNGLVYVVDTVLIPAKPLQPHY